MLECTLHLFDVRDEMRVRGIVREFFGGVVDLQAVGEEGGVGFVDGGGQVVGDRFEGVGDGGVLEIVDGGAVEGALHARLGELGD
jgi:hypothetical protein